ncbi:MAG TPA: heme-binding protein [Patescibacteria group bacterium]|nr:heme-binding protein [Patescibacteria group bacterium]
MLLGLGTLTACFGSGLVLAPAPAQAQCAVATDPCLTAADVTNATAAAAVAIGRDTMVIAVVDRGGNVLGVFRKAGAPAQVVGNFGVMVDANDYAIGLARTGAFFSNDQAPLSSRTVRFISGIHFPPGVRNKPPAALYGIENTNRGCDFGFAIPNVPRATNLAGGPCANGNTAGCGTGINTGKADLFDSNPTTVDGGGVPIFKNGRVAGGIGVSGIPPEAGEYAAFAGSIAGPAFGPRPASPAVIFLDGIRLPFVKNINRPGGETAGVFPGTGAFIAGPAASPLGPVGVPSGYLFGPNASAQLTAAQVNSVISRANNQAQATRAAIRLPLGSTTRMVIAVAGLDGTILGLFRMPDATIFSVDVAVAKARNAIYFSSTGRDPRDLSGIPTGTAVSARTIGFGAMPLFPPGINDTQPGPYFNNFVQDVATPCSQGLDPNNLANQSGIVFFPGSLALYRGGQIVGGLGVSGDGVEQDDLVTAAGVTPDFVPPVGIRADQVFVGGVRLPLFKFPRNPEVK